MAKPGIMVYFDDVLPSLECLTTEDAGRLFIAMLQYGQNGTIPNFRDSVGLNITWNFIRPKIDRDNASYDEAVLKSQYGVYKREAKRRGEAPLDFDEWCQTQSSTSPTPSSPIMGTYPTATSNQELELETQLEKQKEMESAEGMPTTPTPTHPSGKRSRSSFIPPTLDEVTAYVQERGSPVDPQGFIDFYQAKGWMVGKNKMIDWKAACRNAEGWERWRQNGTRNDTRNDRVRTAADYESGDSFFT